MINRRKAIQFGARLTALSSLPAGLLASTAKEAPILVAVELSGGNDGLNSVVPFGDDAY